MASSPCRRFPPGSMCPWWGSGASLAWEWVLVRGSARRDGCGGAQVGSWAAESVRGLSLLQCQRAAVYAPPTWVAGGSLGEGLDPRRRAEWLRVAICTFGGPLIEAQWPKLGLMRSLTTSRPSSVIRVQPRCRALPSRLWRPGCSPERCTCRVGRPGVRHKDASGYGSRLGLLEECRNPGW